MPIQNYLIQWILIQLQVSFENQITIMTPSIGFKQLTMIAVRQKTRNEPHGSIGTKSNSEFLQKRIFIFSNDMLSFWVNSSRFVQILWKLLVTFYSLLPLSLCYLACWAAGQTSWDTKCSIRIGEARNLFFQIKWWWAAFWLEKKQLVSSSLNWPQVILFKSQYVSMDLM